MKRRGLQTFIRRLGADLFGVADLTRYRPYRGFDGRMLRRFPFGISIGIRLSDAIIDGITKEDPTQVYAHHYVTVNALLDNLTLRISNYCQTRGYQALPVPASQTTRADIHQGAISHKAVAALAGLGWIGRSQLLINPLHGPRMRFASVLTEMPMKTSEPIKNRCGSCTECAKSCPVGAIKGGDANNDQWVREDVFDPDSCWERLSTFRDDPLYGVSICGICVKVCPYGKEGRHHEARNPTSVNGSEQRLPVGLDSS